MITGKGMHIVQILAYYLCRITPAARPGIAKAAALWDGALI